MGVSAQGICKGVVFLWGFYSPIARIARVIFAIALSICIKKLLFMKYSLLDWQNPRCLLCGFLTEGAVNAGVAQW